MKDSRSTDFSKESPIKLTKKKPIRAENVVESPSETILGFKKTITTVTDKYLERIKINPVSGAVPSYVRIVIKLLVDSRHNYAFASAPQRPNLDDLSFNLAILTGRFRSIANFSVFFCLFFLDERFSDLFYHFFVISHLEFEIIFQCIT